MGERERNEASLNGTEKREVAGVKKKKKCETNQKSELGFSCNLETLTLNTFFAMYTLDQVSKGGIYKSS